VGVRIAISGIGVVSPIGVGREEYWKGLISGADGVSPIDRFDCSPLRCRLGAQVSNFDAAALLGAKGLKYVDRLSQFALAAVQLALHDAGLELDKMDPHQRAMVLGTAFGGLTSQQDLNRERILDGPSWVSPMKFPNTPINALSYQIPIRHKMRLANVTIPAGVASSLEAVRYSMSLLRRNPDAVVVCGGAEELSFLAYYSSHFREELAGLAGEEKSLPFDRRRNGYLFGEGAAVIVLQNADRAARSLAEIRGYGRSFASTDDGTEGWISAVEASIRSALDAAGLIPNQISLVMASANSSQQTDLVEAQALARVFGARGVAVSAVKSLLGESFGASGALQIAAAVLAMEHGVLPPVFHLDQIDEACPVDCVMPPGRAANVKNVLVNCIDRFGGIASLVLARSERA
jgi:3-oxoacyl-[acyl-carrier-protein] synthase II